MNKTVFITGATSGIGKACAEIFAKNNYNIIITGRREGYLASVKKELEYKYNATITTLCFDVQSSEAVSNAIASLPTNTIVDILINNAGLALGKDAFDEADMQDWETMLQTNVNGLLYTTRALMPFLKISKGHIINIGSIAGKEVYENGNVYCASKHAVDALTKAMRIDLLKHQIKVTAIHPGATETEFSLVRFKADEAKAAQAYHGYTPLYAYDIANAIFYCSTLPEYVCINELTIMCTAQANATTFLKQ